jgi:transcription-repair coupling factor (superfamily II helicase)
LKLICEDSGVNKIRLVATGYNIEFAEKNKLNVDKIINLIQLQPKNFKLLSNNKLNCITNVKQENAIDFLNQLFKDVF